MAHQRPRQGEHRIAPPSRTPPRNGHDDPRRSGGSTPAMAQASGGDCGGPGSRPVPSQVGGLVAARLVRPTRRPYRRSSAWPDHRARRWRRAGAPLLGASSRCRNRGEGATVRSAAAGDSTWACSGSTPPDVPDVHRGLRRGRRQPRLESKRAAAPSPTTGAAAHHRSPVSPGTAGGSRREEPIASGARRSRLRPRSSEADAAPGWCRLRPPLRHISRPGDARASRPFFRDRPGRIRQAPIQSVASRRCASTRCGGGLGPPATDQSPVTEPVDCCQPTLAPFARSGPSGQRAGRRPHLPQPLDSRWRLPLSGRVERPWSDLGFRASVGRCDRAGGLPFTRAPAMQAPRLTPSGGLSAASTGRAMSNRVPVSPQASLNPPSGEARTACAYACGAVSRDPAPRDRPHLGVVGAARWPVRHRAPRRRRRTARPSPGGSAQWSCSTPGPWSRSSGVADGRRACSGYRRTGCWDSARCGAWRRPPQERFARPWPVLGTP